jgi:glycosyltransferase involved in cell wall biosynthesis
MDESQPLISIALCTYNGQAFLRAQLESLFAQTERNFEIVAVDDGSTDGTLALLREYATRDQRLRVHANPSNRGFRVNFEAALSLCRGELIAPCDQDDLWWPTKLATLRAKLGTHSLAYCDSEFIDEQGQSLHQTMSDSFTMVSTKDPLVFALANCVSGHALLFRRSLLALALPIPECFYYDWWLAAVAASVGGVVYCDSKQVSYRLHEHNVTSQLRSKDRHRGDRARQLGEMGRRLERLASLPSNHQQSIASLRDLWTARERQWLSPRLARAVFECAPRLLAMQKRPPDRLRYALKFALGLRTKRILSPYGYAAME